MADFFEIDFLKIDAKQSGDAITLRYSINGIERIHITDGGFQDTGDDIISHINTYYSRPASIDSVIVTHPHEDHTSGLQKVLENFWIRELWMLRPWKYVPELLPRFAYYRNVTNLANKLKEIYSDIAELEKIANRKGIGIYEPFQGAKIGDFTVLAPTKERYFDLIVQSNNTPDASSVWGIESFPSEGTDCENEMSVVQYASLCNQEILLTADAGRNALDEAMYYARNLGINLSDINHFQIPHHGSLGNVSSVILDSLIGTKLPGNIIYKPSVIVSAAKKDSEHPNNTVVRAVMHRGANVVSNESGTLWRHSITAPNRDGWGPATSLPYPEGED